MTQKKTKRTKKTARKADQLRQQALASLNRTVKKAVASFKAPEDLSVMEWSDKYRQLSPENSAEPGRWRTSRTPYLEEPMNAFTDPKVHTIVVVASSQVGKTEMELNMLGYEIDIDPGPAMWVTPTAENAEDFSKRRIAPMIRDTKPLRKKVSGSAAGRKASNAILKKKYPGGMLTLTGSSSPANLASVPARYVFGDEIDRWATDAGGEGDPWSLLEARTATFYNRKMVMVSTPTVKGRSRIAKAFDTGTREYWCVQCPHCGEWVFVEFDNIRFKHEKIQVETGGDVQYRVHDVVFCCPECGCISDEQTIKHAPHEWVAENPDAYQNGVRSFWINAFSSPWMSWEHIILRFLEASGNGDPQKLQTVFNTLLGKLWEDRGDLATDDEMIERREHYGAELPDGVLALTMGVDTQDNRLEYEVVGYGRFNETWGIQKGVIMGSPGVPDLPGKQSVWTRLDRLIDKDWTFANGKSLRISVTFVDSGGHYTQDVYEQCARRLNKRVFAVKGKGGEGIPFTKAPTKVDIVREGRAVGKAWLYTIGVDAGKERIMKALKIGDPGPGYCHFPDNAGRSYDGAFFNGLLSEKLTLKGTRWTWEKIPGHQRNEPLDCRNYANAAEQLLNPNFDRIENELRNEGTEKTEAPRPTRRKIIKKQQKRRDYFDNY